MSLFRKSKNPSFSPVNSPETEEQKQIRLQKEAEEEEIRKQHLLQDLSQIIDIFKYYGYEAVSDSTTNSHHTTTLIHSDTKKRLITKDSAPILLPRYLIVQVSGQWNLRDRYMIFPVFDYADGVIDEAIASGLRDFSSISNYCTQILSPKPFAGTVIFSFSHTPYFTVEQVTEQVSYGWGTLRRIVHITDKNVRYEMFRRWKKEHGIKESD